MSYRNDRFNESMYSLEMALGDTDPDKAPFLSDNGQGVNRLLDAVDIGAFGVEPDPEYVPRESCPTCDSCGNCRPCPLANIIAALIAAGKGYLIPTLLLIVQYGDNRTASIREIMKSRKISWKTAWNLYFHHRNLLLAEVHYG